MMRLKGRAIRLQPVEYSSYFPYVCAPVSKPARYLSMTDPIRLRITEIFLSLQGESTSVGCPTVFVRLTGCPLRCGYCDTDYAFQGGEWMTLESILEQVGRYRIAHVTVTGGEPLAQKACLPLLQQLCDAGYHVSLETSGALDISTVDPRVNKVLDLKTPGSGEVELTAMQTSNCWGRRTS
jgi:7-carboxy-7-deazaguanine synthase